MKEINQSTTTDLSAMTNSKHFERPKRELGLMHKTLSLCLLVVTLTLAACSPSTSTPGPGLSSPATSAPQITVMPTQPIPPQATSTPQQTATSTSAATPQATSGSQQGSIQTSLDPCQLITSQEASALAGVTFGSGEEGSTPEGLRTCTYGAQTTHVFMVDVAEAADVKTAQDLKTQFLADLQANLQKLTNAGLKVTEVPNFADGAIMATVNVSTGPVTINGISMGFLKGKVYFGFSDLAVGGTVPTSEGMQSMATTVLGRLP